MKKSIAALLLAAIFALEAHPQDSLPAIKSNWQMGLELDLLPYATGGYFGAVWAGRGHWRLRALTAYVKKPEWTTEEGFQDHRIHAYALLADYFFKPGWKGWWLGSGPVVWRSTIQSESGATSEPFYNLLLHGCAGYHLWLAKWLYCSPWAGLGIRLAGETSVPVGDQFYSLPLVNPELSIKLGCRF